MSDTGSPEPLVFICKYIQIFTFISGKVIPWKDIYSDIAVCELNIVQNWLEAPFTVFSTGKIDYLTTIKLLGIKLLQHLTLE